MKKERIILAASLALNSLALPWTTKHVSGELDVKEDCKTVYIESGLVRGGITIPASLDGKKTIIIYDGRSKTLNHEWAHAEQVCEEGTGPFLKNYIANPEKYERDAEERAKKR